MTANMMQKVENLRNYIEGMNLTYDHLCSILRSHEEFPSMTSLRKYGLLKVVAHEEYEVTMTDNEASYQCYEDMDSYEWDEDRELWVSMESVNYYGI